MVKPNENIITNKKQMKLKNFCEAFDIPRTTILKWVYEHGFPAYNLFGHWYVDIDEYYKWKQVCCKKN